MSADSNHSSKPNISRRQLLNAAWGVSLAALAGESVGILSQYIQPNNEGGFGGVLNVGSVDAFAPGSVTLIKAGRFYLYRLEDGSFLALWQKCTHLGCSVPWVAEENQFRCPCHGSIFTREGEVLGGPAPRPLDLFPVTIENGEVYVDTGNPITRASFEPGQTTKA